MSSPSELLARPYQAEISRANPACFLFLIDQSGSMNDPWGGGESGARKADALATIINRLLTDIVVKCSKDEGVRDYFEIGVIGYGDRVGAALGGALTGRLLAPVSAIADAPLRVEDRVQKIPDGAGGVVEQTVKFPVWFAPAAHGGTPMGAALRAAHQALSGWIAEHRAAFPPVVFNVTDGEATDGDPSAAAAALRDLATDDGHVLLFNLHLSSHRGRAIEFPDSEAELPDQFARLLFRMSSVLPPHLQDEARAEGYRVSEATRGFAFNADAVAVVQFLNIGTRPANLR